jgi:hypothetical protein
MASAEGFAGHKYAADTVYVCNVTYTHTHMPVYNFVRPNKPYNVIMAAAGKASEGDIDFGCTNEDGSAGWFLFGANGSLGHAPWTKTTNHETAK